MNLVVCPHCKSHRLVTAKVPKDVVAVMPCPSCGELVVLFRKKVVALNREILEHGSMDERKDHLATIIAEFLEPGMFTNHRRGEDNDSGSSRGDRTAEPVASDDSEGPAPITQREIDEFTKIHLERLDDAKYFRKHFG